MNNAELETKIAALERAVERERKARKSAEDVLRQKAMEVFEIQQRLKVSTERLTLSLWASQEVVWEYNAKDDIFRLYTAIAEKEVKVSQKGTFSNLIESISPDLRASFQQQWEDHTQGKTKGINAKVMRMSHHHGMYRWVRIRGRVTKRDKQGVATHYIGMFSDIHDRVIRDETYQTIVDAFLQSTRPGFIINLVSMHVECNDLCMDILGLSREEVKQAQLRERLPVDCVLTNVKEQNQKFAAGITLPDTGKTKVGVYLSEVPNMDLPNPHCVAFFTKDIIK
jgi:PAS domain-containing protein